MLNVTAVSSQDQAAYPYPPQCAALSNNSYNYKLFFGFGTVAAVFLLLRFGIVRQSKPLPDGKAQAASAPAAAAATKPATAPATANLDNAEKGIKVPALVKDDKEQEMDNVGGGGDDEEEESEERERRRRRHKRRHHRRDRRRRDDEEEEGSEGGEKEEGKEESS